MRPVLAVLAAAVVWAVTMPALIILLAQVWPALAAAVRAYRESGGFDSFDPLMLIVFQFFWPLTNAATGLVTVLISRRQLEVRVVTVLLVAYFAYNHWWVYWDDFPVWYNVLVVLLVAPFVLLGGRIPALLKGARTANSAAAG